MVGLISDEADAEHRQLQSSLDEYEWVQEGTKWVKRLTPAAAEAKKKAEEDAEAELREAQRLEIEAHRAAMKQARRRADQRVHTAGHYGTHRSSFV
jgi:hypothetical protein|tara:strand:+ start:110 stop:397 length:288 start_codon:yes stop_codon:yes gene_type:complete